MKHIVTVQEAVTAFADFMEPTAAELDAIEREMPVILADVDLLDAHITTLDRTPTELDARRIPDADGPAPPPHPPGPPPGAGRPGRAGQPCGRREPAGGCRVMGRFDLT